MPRILVADDDDAMRTMLASTCRRHGFEVDEARDGNDLYRQIRQAVDAKNLPDLIVSDIRMPGSSGLDVLYALMREKVAIPVILITAFGDDWTHRRASELGAVVVFDKPFSLRVLEERILELVANRAGSPSDP